MQPSRSAPLVVGAAVALTDAIALRRAWLPGADRPIAWATIACVVGAATLAAIAWEGAVTLLPRRWRALAGTLPYSIFVALPLAATHAAHALGPFSTVILLATMIAGFTLARTLAVTRGRPRAVTGVALLVSLTLLIEHARLPPSLWPGLHALIVVTAFALGCYALDARAPTGRAALVAVAGAVTLALAGSSLLSRAGNARFVVHRQAPVAGLLLSALDRSASTPSDRSWPAIAPAARRADGDYRAANLLLVTVDALRADAKLPELEKRAQVRFRRVYAQAPHTAWSISSLLTGVYPDRLAGAKPPTLAERLRAHHFYTDAFYPAGLFFDGRAPLERYARTHFGFEWSDTRTLDARALTDAVLTRLDQERRQWSDEPRMFFWAHYFDPHEPYLAHDGTPADAPPRERYQSEVAFVDRELARLVDRLPKRGRPTLVVVTADHGEEFGEHGGAYHGTSVYEEQVRVPLVLFVVGGAPLQTREVDAPIELVDLAPTLSSLLGFDEAGFEGRSVQPELFGEDTPARDAHAQVGTRRMLVRDHQKLIHDLRGDVVELYDLQRDPAEQRNLVDEQPKVAAMLKASLDDWFALPSTSELEQVLADRRAAPERRASAARLLAQRQPPEAARLLAGALDDADATVRAEAALALASYADRRARPSLVALLDEPRWRRKAALALGQLRAPEAVPALKEATRDIDVTLRRHAVHYLGFLAPASDAALLEARARDDLKVRGDAYRALGRLAARTRSAEAMEFLLSRLPVEEYDDARADLAWALGLAAPALSSTAKAEARAALTPLLLRRPPLPNAGEALVRLGAAAVDFAPGVAASNVGGCTASSDDNVFAGATVCTQRPGIIAAIVEVPAGVSMLVLRARAPGAAGRERLLVDGKPLGAVELGPAFAQSTLTLAPVAPGRHRLELDLDGGAAELDWVLLVPASDGRRMTTGAN